MTNPPPPRLSGEEKHIVFTYNRLAHRFGDEWQDVSRIEADNRPYEIIQAWRHLTAPGGMLEGFEFEYSPQWETDLYDLLTDQPPPGSLVATHGPERIFRAWQTESEIMRERFIEGIPLNSPRRLKLVFDYMNKQQKSVYFLLFLTLLVHRFLYLGAGFGNSFWFSTIPVWLVFLHEVQKRPWRDRASSQRFIFRMQATSIATIAIAIVTRSLGDGLLSLF